MKLLYTIFENGDSHSIRIKGKIVLDFLRFRKGKKKLIFLGGKINLT